MKKAATKTVVMLTLICGTMAIMLYALQYYRANTIPKQPLLPVKFEHADHRETRCVKCHHNFIDNTGGGTCYQCHKLSPAINLQMEAMFHDLCADCHLEKRMAGEESGPLRECAGCHQA